MKGVQLPPGFRTERLTRAHARQEFESGQKQVDDWIQSKALQNQEKFLSTTKVLLGDQQTIVGFYTLATGQISFADFPAGVVKRLPKRVLPVAFIAWLGVASPYQGQGFARRLLASALIDCWQAAQIVGSIAVVLDAIDDRAQSFYKHAEFTELPGNTYRLFMSMQELEGLMKKTVQ